MTGGARRAKRREPDLALRRPGMRRSTLIGLAGVIVVGLLAGLVWYQIQRTDCGVTRVDEPKSVLLDPARMAEQVDPQLDQLAETIAGHSPFGDVRAGVGFNYDQWLSLYALNDAWLVRTKDNAPYTILDEETLDPRWAITADTSRTAWDASADRFALLELDAERPTRVTLLTLTKGGEVWCAALDEAHTEGDPLTTAFLDEDLVVAMANGAASVTLRRLSGDDGRARWVRTLHTAAVADFVSEWDGLLVVGGQPEHELAELSAVAGARPEKVAALDPETGETEWTWEGSSPGARVHVVGVTADHLILTERSVEGPELVALDRDGEEVWRVPTAGVAFEATLRGETIITRSRLGLQAYAAADGKQTWRFATEAGKNWFPYGFTLDSMPSLSEMEMLVPGTTSLEVFDLTTGDHTSVPLPVDGFKTTFWPYQLGATTESIGVVTNTGGVILERSDPLR